jgi:hemerythrin-like domain-containing protein
VKPIAPLMIEHRLIERMIRVLARHREHISAGGDVDLSLLDHGLDFLRTYADRCHHGKEEDIFFRSLMTKDITADQRALVDELLAEHQRARGLVRRLADAKDRCAAGDRARIAEVAEILPQLTELYPQHIEKEDKRLFLPAMEYYTADEQAAMLDQFREFDRKLIHDKYRAAVEQAEQGEA